jgi:NAD(P)H-hydrate epimerase
VRILTAAQMREADRFTIDEIGIPSLVLMENAGRQVVAAIEAGYEEQLSGRVAVLCGRGNNGGDGFVVARTLLQRGVDTAVFVIGSLADVRGDARTNLDILGRLGVTVVEIGDEQSWELHFSEISQCTLIVDAILGSGLHSPVSGNARDGLLPTSTPLTFRLSRSICQAACRPTRRSCLATASARR